MYSELALSGNCKPWQRCSERAAYRARQLSASEHLTIASEFVSVSSNFNWQLRYVTHPLLDSVASFACNYMEALMAFEHVF